MISKPKSDRSQQIECLDVVWYGLPETVAGSGGGDAGAACARARGAGTARGRPRRGEARSCSPRPLRRRGTAGPGRTHQCIANLIARANEPLELLILFLT